MAEEISSGGAPAPVAAPEPVAAAVEAAPAPVATEAAPAPSPEVAAAPVSETPAAPAAVDPEKPAEPAAAPAVATEAAKTETPAAPAPAPAEPAATPTYEDFKLPEGFQASAEMVGPFTEFLGSKGLSQEDGQALMDMHAAAMKTVADDMVQRQFDVFAETRAGWRKDAEKAFGNRFNTAVADGKWAKHELFGKDAKASAAFESMIEASGVGDHPAMIDAFSRVTKRLRERPAPPVGVPATRPASAADKRYGPRPAR